MRNQAKVLVVSAMVFSSALACASDPIISSSKRTDGPEVEKYSQMRTTDGALLPIEKYLISPEESEIIERARSVLVARCMKRFGYSFAPRVPDAVEISDQTEHRYDPTSLKEASRRGYHPVGSRGGDGKDADLAIAPTEEMMTFLVGEESAHYRASKDGIRLPKGGCVGEADQEITSEGGIILDSELAVSVNFRNYTRALRDYRLIDVFDSWSKCMMSYGHVYKTPLEAANDSKWKSEAPSARELAVAIADVKCKNRHNVIGVWFAVESAYEREDIERNLPELKRVRRSIDAAVSNAIAVI